jgi:hypothetical protein
VGGEQVLDSAGGRIVGGRDLDDGQARLFKMRVMDRPHTRHDVSAPVKVLAIARASPVRGREPAWEPRPDHG